MLRQHLTPRLNVRTLILAGAALALAVLAPACTMSGKTEVVRVTATPQPVAEVATRPYVTPTPPPVPTPTVEPHA
ncbi:MAG: hypothetical protein IT325_01860, partial [Anaerolineae bacterium]|nr:hypothetical protein [Anaerolineae bacterium]